MDFKAWRRRESIHSPWCVLVFWNNLNDFWISFPRTLFPLHVNSFFLWLTSGLTFSPNDLNLINSSFISDKLYLILINSFFLHLVFHIKSFSGCKENIHRHTYTHRSCFVVDGIEESESCKKRFSMRFRSNEFLPFRPQKATEIRWKGWKGKHSKVQNYRKRSWGNKFQTGKTVQKHSTKFFLTFCRSLGRSMFIRQSRFKTALFNKQNTQKSSVRLSASLFLLFLWTLIALRRKGGHNERNPNVFVFLINKFSNSSFAAVKCVISFQSHFRPKKNSTNFWLSVCHTEPSIHANYRTGMFLLTNRANRFSYAGQSNGIRPKTPNCVST